MTSPFSLNQNPYVTNSGSFSQPLTELEKSFFSNPCSTPTELEVTSRDVSKEGCRALHNFTTESQLSASPVGGDPLPSYEDFLKDTKLCSRQKSRSCPSFTFSRLRQEQSKKNNKISGIFTDCFRDVNAANLSWPNYPISPIISIAPQVFPLGTTNESNALSKGLRFSKLLPSSLQEEKYLSLRKKIVCSCDFEDLYKIFEKTPEEKRALILELLANDPEQSDGTCEKSILESIKSFQIKIELWSIKP